MLKINKALVKFTLLLKGKMMKYIFLILTAMLLTTGCTKKEFKSNWHNVKDGTKKRWKEGKKEFSGSTKEYEENNKKDGNKTK